MPVIVLSRGLSQNEEFDELWKRDVMTTATPLELFAVIGSKQVLDSRGDVCPPFRVCGNLVKVRGHQTRVGLAGEEELFGR